MKLKSSCLCWMPVALLGLGLAGCQPANDSARVPVNTPEVVAHRKQFQLGGEPAGALPLGEIPDLLEAAAADAETDNPAPEPASQLAEREVVFVARVGGVPASDMADNQDFPWEPGRAAFMVSDPTSEAPSQHNHAGGGHDNCPFCAKQKAAGPMALVRCVGTDGEALDVDARDLLTIAENDIVVVEGTARMVGDTLIVVDAKGIYVRR